MPAYFATTAWGIENVAAAELAALGADAIQPVTGGVKFEGDLAVLYRSLLWLRTATRVVKPLREFAAAHPEMLYSQVRRVRWEDYLNPRMTFAVYATLQGSGVRSRASVSDQQPAEKAGSTPRKGSRSNKGKPGKGRAEKGKAITHSQYAALKIKDAIVDRLRREQGARPDIDTENPDIRVAAHFANGRCTLSLDATGASLHERGYRLATTGAPLKETLAAAIIDLTGWSPDQPLLDPMCGSGTLLIEAALKACRIAPGLFRKSFCCQRWPDFDRSIWDKEVQVAQASQVRPELKIFGSDIDPRAIDVTKENAKRAGVEKCLTLRKGKAEETRPPPGPPGVVVVNPPYGERLGDATELETLYNALGKIWKEQFSGWRCHLLAGNLPLARHIPLHADGKTKLFNSALECRLLAFDIRDSATTPVTGSNDPR